MSDFSKDELEELLGKDISEEDSPYCKLCSSCGESGCCSPLRCFSKLIKNDKCQNGEGYLLDIQIALEFSDWVLGYFNNKDNLTAKDANRKYSEMMDRIYGEDNK